jgi:hypothetical protein
VWSGWNNRRCGSNPRPNHHSLQGFHEIRKILEVSVDAGETHIGHGIEALERIHNQVTQATARDLAVRLIQQPGLNIADGLLQLGKGHRTLLTGGHHATEQLLWVEGLTTTVLFHNEHGHLFHAFIACEASTAGQALAAAADGITLPTFPGIHYLILEMAAEGATHSTRLQAMSRRLQEIVHPSFRRGCAAECMLGFRTLRWRPRMEFPCASEYEKRREGIRKEL